MRMMLRQPSAPPGAASSTHAARTRRLRPRRNSGTCLGCVPLWLLPAALHFLLWPLRALLARLPSPVPLVNRLFRALLFSENELTVVAPSFELFNFDCRFQQVAKHSSVVIAFGCASECRPGAALASAPF
jgi:hypothetical protein